MSPQRHDNEVKYRKEWLTSQPEITLLWTTYSETPACLPWSLQHFTYISN